MSTTLSTNSGSVDSLKVSVRCGLRPKVRQIRPIVDLLSPDLSAICLRDQWVASVGVSSSVATTTASTCSTVIDGGRPGRSSSISPSSRRATKRPRHLPTVAGCTPRSAATCVFGAPSAHASTILERWASAWDDLARRDQRTSVSRSAAVSRSSAFGRPVLAMAASLTYPSNFRRRTLAVLGHSFRWNSSARDRIRSHRLATPDWGNEPGSGQSPCRGTRLLPPDSTRQRWGPWGAAMIGKVLGGTAGIIAAPVVGGLVWRKARQRRVAKALEITTPNGIVEERFVKVGGIEQWIQLRGEDRDNPVLLVLHGGPGWPNAVFTLPLRP